MKLLLKILLASILILSASNASAQVYKRCDYCTNPLSVAKSVKRSAEVIIVDYPRNALYAYEVEYDHETRRSFATETAVPSSHAALLNQVRTSKGQHTIWFDNRQGTLGGLQYGFPAGYEHLTAYDIVTDTMVRRAFMSAIATAVVGSSSPAMQNFASLLYGIMSSLGINGETVVVHLVDGSKIVARLDQHNVLQALLISAEDKYQHPFAMPGLEDGGVEPGTYNFGNDSLALDQWIHAAALYGVQIVGSHGTASVCVGSGDNRICYVQVY